MTGGRSVKDLIQAYKATDLLRPWGFAWDRALFYGTSGAGFHGDDPTSLQRDYLQNMRRLPETLNQRVKTTVTRYQPRK
jgi:hypothetical protein